MRPVRTYDITDAGNKSFSCWKQFVAMSFGQLTFRDSLRAMVFSNAYFPALFLPPSAFKELSASRNLMV